MKAREEDGRSWTSTGTWPKLKYCQRNVCYKFVFEMERNKKGKNRKTNQRVKSWRNASVNILILVS
jgi:hypothetical protein